MGSGGVYPKHEKLVDRVNGFDADELTPMMRKLSFLAQTKTHLHGRQA
jgi:hypothetical protein